MPVFLFACSQAEVLVWWQVLVAFVAIHFFLYPASNAYNSYFDKDEQSIGGIKHPPPVSKELYQVALLFDAIALVLAYFLAWPFALALFIYGLVSKAYSHPGIRLKKYPIMSWLVVGIFQGAFTYLMSYYAVTPISQLSTLWQPAILYPALLSSILLMASYPMTQVYQHEEDTRRGDVTLSVLLGVKGTFLFSGVLFFIANAGFLVYFYYYKSLQHILIFELVLLPTLLYFSWWFQKVRKDESAANFDYTMRLNTLSSLLISLGFVLMWVI